MGFVVRPFERCIKLKVCQASNAVLQGFNDAIGGVFSALLIVGPGIATGTGAIDGGNIFRAHIVAVAGAQATRERLAPVRSDWKAR